MGAIRVTQGLLVQRTLSDLNSQLRSILKLQEQLATGQRVNRPSDDPLDARRAVSLRILIAESEQFISNIADAQSPLTESDTTLQTVVDILQRGQELAITGANGTLAQLQRDQLAVEVNQLLESLVESANHKTNNRFIFGGTRTSAEPFETTRLAGEITAVTYVGNEDAIAIEAADGVHVQINEPGSNAFLDTINAFQALISLRDGLRAGDQAAVGNTIDELDGAIDQALLSLARIGATQNRLDRISFNTEEFVTQFQETLSDKIDADFAETIVGLNAEQNALNAALNAGARVIQLSLLDFIR